MNSSERLKILIDSGKTVFKLSELQILWRENQLNTKISALRMLKKSLIIRITKGYYALNYNYNIYELANLIIKPSYVSFNSALSYKGLNFQPRKEIDSVSLINYKKIINNVQYKYFSMKKELFFNLEGVIIRDNVSVACPERAMLDCFYFGFLPDISNKEKLNITYLKKLSEIYPYTVQKKIKRFL